MTHFLPTTCLTCNLNPTQATRLPRTVVDAHQGKNKDEDNKNYKDEKKRNLKLRTVEIEECD